MSNFSLRILAVLLLSIALLPGLALAESDCTDGIDNDGDLLIDCLDDSCDLAPCDDGVSCTTGETCDFATTSCTGGTPDDLLCDDSVGCTVDTCDATLDCQFAPNDAVCDNAVFCDGAETCDATLDCQAGTPPTCDDAVACTDDSCNIGTDSCDNLVNDANCDDGVGCTVDTCDATLDCQFAPNDAVCDNAVFCDGAETCDATLDCQAGTPPTCDDAVACTDDSCNIGTDSCDNLVNDANCDNAVFCDGAETCDATLDCQAGTPPTCDDGIGCTDDSCNIGTDTCDNIANAGNCDNGVFCDGPETCDALGDCQPGVPPTCDDSVGCTVDSCNLGTDSCDNLTDDSVCTNGLVCDGLEFCDAVLDCQAGTGIDCSGLVTDCLSAVCDEGAAGCITSPINEGGVCSDGDTCTATDICVAGTCSGSGTTCGDSVVDAACGETCDPPTGELCDTLEDEDGDGLGGCLDPDCCGAVTPSCGSDCTDAAFCKQILNDPAIIRYTNFPRALFKFHGRVVLNPLDVDLINDGFGVSLSNANGTIYSGNLLAGDLVQRGSGRYSFKDKSAKIGPGIRDGLYRIRLVFRKVPGTLTSFHLHVKVKAYGDFSGVDPTLTFMTTQVSGVDDVAMVQAFWNQTRAGWKLPNRNVLFTQFVCNQ